MEYEMVSKMKVDELKMYLRLRGLKVTGIKAELVARVFVASETDVWRLSKLPLKLNQIFKLSIK